MVSCLAQCCWARDKAGADEEEENEQAMQTTVEFGYPVPTFCTRANMERLGTPLPDDIFVCSYPKSGTNWLKWIVHLVRRRGKGEGDLEKGDLADICPFLEGDKDTQHDKMIKPRVYHSHLMYQHLPKGARVIYIMRDLPDSASSLATFLVRIGTVPPDYKADTAAKQMINGTSYSGAWSKHVSSFWEARKEPSVLLLKFEDLKQDLEGQIRKVAKFLAVDLDDAAVSRIADQASFDNMKKNEKHIMGKEWLTRIVGGAPASEAYTIMHEGKVGSAARFQAETLAEIAEHWAETMEPLVGAGSYAEWKMDDSPSK